MNRFQALAVPTPEISAEPCDGQWREQSGPWIECDDRPVAVAIIVFGCGREVTARFCVDHLTGAILRDQVCRLHPGDETDVSDLVAANRWPS